MCACMWFCNVCTHLSFKYVVSLRGHRPCRLFLPMCNVHLNEDEDPWLHKATRGVVTIDEHAGSHPSSTSEVGYVTF